MRDLNELFGTLDTIPAPDVRVGAQGRLADAERPTPPFGGGRGNRAVVIAVAFLVFVAAAAYAWRAVSTTGSSPATSTIPSATEAPVPPSSRVFFAWPGQIIAVDVATGATDTVSVPTLHAGDPQVYLARIGDRLAYWGYDIYTLDPEHLDAPPVKIANGSWFFVPSATPGRIWAVWRDDRSSTPYHFFFDHLREIDSTGNVTVDGTAHGDSWMDGAVSAGVLLETRDGLTVWDPEAGKVVAQLNASSAAATFGNTVVWCDNHCPQLHLTDVITGEDRTIDPPIGYLVFSAWDGVFTPDGSTFAVPVSSTPHPGPGGTQAVALIDVATGSVTGLVPGSASNAGCCQLSWDSTGQRLDIARYESNGKTEGWRLSYWDVGSSSTVEVPVELPHSVAMVAG
jgi:hypothetical protein